MDGIRAVGFDLDGTFMRTRVDYAKLNAADRRICVAHGIPFDEIDFGSSPKRPRRPIEEWLASHGRGSEAAQLFAEMDREFTRCECEFVREAVPFPGSVESLRAIRARGLKVGLLTRGSREYALRALGPLSGEFDVVMGRDHSHYDNAKPSPVAMREFAEELGVEPSEILYVGDNVTDWYSARDAGARFAGVLTGSGSREVWNSEDPSIPVLEHAGDVVSLLRPRLRRGIIRAGCVLMPESSDSYGCIGAGRFFPPRALRARGGRDSRILGHVRADSFLEDLSL